MVSFPAKSILFGTFISCLALQAQAEAKFDVYGFAQVDYIQDFNRVNPNWMDTLRPSKLPAFEGEFGSDGQASISAKQTRFGVKTSLPVEGQDLTTKVEFDFFGTGTDEGQTTIRFRYGYGEWGDWLGGQTESLFMDLSVFPNVIDYWGPAGMIFIRNPQIRWTPIHGDVSIAVALEKPSDDIDPGQIRDVDPGFGNSIQSHEKVPDLTAQWRMQKDWGHFQVAGVLRQLSYETLAPPNNEPSDDTMGWGLGITGSVKFFENDKLLYGLVSGEGISNYFNDDGVDLAPEGTVGNFSAKAVPVTGYLLYYDRAWSDKMTSSIGFSQSESNNTNFQTATAFHRGQYASVNLLFHPHKNVMWGGEYLWGQRVANNGFTSEDNRVQISLKYSFSSLDFAGKAL